MAVDLTKRMFSDAKADELIAAIQGLAGSGSSGMSDAAKAALINCFLKVTWVDDSGADLIQALITALYNGDSPTPSNIVYEIPSNTDISSRYEDTEQHAFTLDENFTIVEKVTVSNIPSGTTDMFLLDSQVMPSSGNPIVGIRQQAQISNRLITFRFTFNGDNNAGGIGNAVSNNFSSSNDHTLIYYIVNNNKRVISKLYVDGTLYDNNDIVLVDKSGAVYPATYYIGKNQGNANRPWKGTVDILKIYNKALSISEIENVLGL